MVRGGFGFYGHTRLSRVFLPYPNDTRRRARQASLPLFLSGAFVCTWRGSGYTPFAYIVECRRECRQVRDPRESRRSVAETKLRETTCAPKFQNRAGEAVPYSPQVRGVRPAWRVVNSRMCEDCQFARRVEAPNIPRTNRASGSRFDFF